MKKILMARWRRRSRSPAAARARPAAAAKARRASRSGSSAPRPSIPSPSAVAERFAQAQSRASPRRSSNRPAPARGIKLFCGGVGAAASRHRQRLAPDQGERARAVQPQRRQPDHRGPGRHRRPRPDRIGAAADRLPADRRATSTRRSPPIRSAGRRPRGPGATSIRRCPPSRSRSTARRRPRARATASPS